MSTKQTARCSRDQGTEVDTHSKMFVDADRAGAEHMSRSRTGFFFYVNSSLAIVMYECPRSRQPLKYKCSNQNSLRHWTRRGNDSWTAIPRAPNDGCTIDGTRVCLRWQHVYRSQQNQKIKVSESVGHIDTEENQADLLLLEAMQERERHVGTILQMMNKQ
jgi:hypothetical protein